MSFADGFGFQKPASLHQPKRRHSHLYYSVNLDCIWKLKKWRWRTRSTAPKISIVDYHFESHWSYCSRIGAFALPQNSLIIVIYDDILVARCYTGHQRSFCFPHRRLALRSCGNSYIVCAIQVQILVKRWRLRGITLETNGYIWSKRRGCHEPSASPSPTIPTIGDLNPTITEWGTSTLGNF